MRTGTDVPGVPATASLRDAVLEMTNKRMGMTAVLDTGGRVVGIFTDGDLRRSLDRLTDIRSIPIAEVMTRDPRTIRSEQLAAAAVEIMERHKVNQILVTGSDGRLVGALNMHDLFRAKVI
jgi:arabinose-5-phosphate isomerase